MYMCCMYGVLEYESNRYPHDSDRRRTTATGPAEPGFSSMAMGSGRGESYPMGLYIESSLHTLYSAIYTKVYVYSKLYTVF